MTGMLPSLTTPGLARAEQECADAGGAIGAYYYREVRWRTIAASIIDPETQAETIDHDEIGRIRLEREWRFRDYDYALIWLEILVGEGFETDQDKPTPIADMPHRCNGHVVRISQEISDDA